MAQGTRSLRRGELLAILGEIHRDKETGTLVLQQGQVSKFLYAQDGNLIFAASNSPEDKFTQILIDKGKLTPEQLALAQEKKEGRTIGRTLVEMGFLGSEDLLEALISQMRKIATSVLDWESGFAAFKPGILPPNLAKLPISTPRFIVDTALSIEDRDWAAASLGRLEIPIQIDQAHRDLAKTLTLTADEMRVLERIDGQRNARQVCLDADVNLFSGVRFLIGLYYLGWVTIEQASAAPGQKPTKEPMDLSFLDKVAPSVPPAHAMGEVPVTPRRLPPEPKAAAIPLTVPEPLPFEAQEESEELRAGPEPEPLPAPLPVPAEESPKPQFQPALKIELIPTPAKLLPPGIVSEPQLLAPLGEEEEEEEEEAEDGPSRSGAASSESDESQEPRHLGRFIGIVAATFVVGIAFVAGYWFLFLRKSPQIPLTPKPPVSKPLGTKPKPAPKPNPQDPLEGQPGHPASEPFYGTIGLPKPAPGATQASAPKPPEIEPVVPAPTPQAKPVPAPQPKPAAGVTQPPVSKPPEAKPVVPAPTPQPKPAPAPQPKPTPAPEPKPPSPSVPPSLSAGSEDGRKSLAAGDYAKAAQAFQRAMLAKRGGFTINVEVACQSETVAKGLAAAGSSPEYMILPYDLKGRSCFRVIWGHYADRASAETALKELPAFFKQGASPQIAPWK